MGCKKILKIILFYFSIFNSLAYSEAGRNLNGLGCYLSEYCKCMTHPPQNTVCQGRTTATGAWRDSTATATTARKDHWATKTHISLHFITIQGWSMAKLLMAWVRTCAAPKLVSRNAVVKILHMLTTVIYSSCLTTARFTRECLTLFENFKNNFTLLVA